MSGASPIHRVYDNFPFRIFRRPQGAQGNTGLFRIFRRPQGAQGNTGLFRIFRRPQGAQGNTGLFIVLCPCGFQINGKIVVHPDTSILYPFILPSHFFKNNLPHVVEKYNSQKGIVCEYSTPLKRKDKILVRQDKFP